MTALTEQHATSSGQERFFGTPMYAVQVEGWPADRVHPQQPLTDPVAAPEQARLRMWSIDPHDERPIPPAGDASPMADVGQFSLVNSGNRTLTAPKRPWKVDLYPGEVAGVSTLTQCRRSAG